MEFKRMNRVYDEILPKTIDALEATDFDYIKQKFGTISGSTICTGSGGSSVVSQYLAKILNAKNGCVAESRYPRELKFMNLTNYDNVIAISYSGNNSGVTNSFDNNCRHILFTANPKFNDNPDAIVCRTTMPE